MHHNQISQAMFRCALAFSTGYSLGITLEYAKKRSFYLAAIAETISPSYQLKSLYLQYFDRHRKIKHDHNLFFNECCDDIGKFARAGD